jgi:hypothetical protein
LRLGCTYSRSIWSAILRESAKALLLKTKGTSYHTVPHPFRPSRDRYRRGTSSPEHAISTTHEIKLHAGQAAPRHVEIYGLEISLFLARLAPASLERWSPSLLAFFFRCFVVASLLFSVLLFLSAGEP